MTDPASESDTTAYDNFRRFGQLHPFAATTVAPKVIEAIETTVKGMMSRPNTDPADESKAKVFLYDAKRSLSAGDPLYTYAETWGASIAEELDSLRITFVDMDARHFTTGVAEWGVASVANAQRVRDWCLREERDSSGDRAVVKVLSKYSPIYAGPLGIQTKIVLFGDNEHGRKILAGVMAEAMAKAMRAIDQTQYTT